ncbi:Uncharacterized protein Fot_06086 [Forsythia ovata]|uniref:Uncharacterized protein n=1 Tax=Forsythia ovata TaxID=205694 RepID=A0ABD1WSB3_9LAMI
MVKSKGQSINIELEICINSKRSKMNTPTSGSRIKRSKNSVQEDFKELENVRNDEFENNDFNNYNEFETDDNDGSQLKDFEVEREVQVEDNDGSQLKDFEVESQSKAVIREIRSGTSALSDEINVVDGVVQEQQILNPPFSFGILEVVDKRWFYDLRTP